MRRQLKASIEPLLCDAERKIRLVLVIGLKHLDRKARGRRPRLVDRLLRARDTRDARGVRIQAGEVGQHAHADRTGALRPRAPRRNRESRSGSPQQCTTPKRHGDGPPVNWFEQTTRQLPVQALTWGDDLSRRQGLDGLFALEQPH